MPALFRLLLLLVLTAGLRAAEPILTIISPDKTITLTAAEFAALPHSDSTVTDPHHGQTLHLSGVTGRDLLALVDAPLGPKLRGPALQLAVVARARDGYSVVFSLAEFDEAFSDRTIIIADREDGKPLPDTDAPLRLIAPGDKRPARWIRLLTSLEIIRISGAASPKP